VSRPHRVAVLGQGYVGLPVAMRAVACGYDVVGVDVDPHRIDLLGNGSSFAEDVPDAELAAALESGRYLPTTNPARCEGFDVAVITVPTPLREGVPDVSFIHGAATSIGPFVREGSLVVLESTTYPGTTDEVVRPILEQSSGLVADRDFGLGYSPERIDPGNQEYPFWATPKLVSGVGPASLRAVESFYATLVAKTVTVSSPKVAELAKLLENTFRHVNIAMVNEVAMFAGDLGIDVWEAVDAASTKPYGYHRFVPGPGVGGHCLPIDPSYLSWRVMRRLGVPFRFVELANDINAHMPDYVARRVTYSLNARSRAVNGSQILLLGLAYKPNTSDARESPAVVVAERLIALGARVRAHDRHVGACRIDDRVTRVPLTEDEVRAADLVVVLADHDDVDYPMVARHAASILDTRHRIRGDTVEYL
jgi:UDP-N-acetyl-D-glucosamine dehydrogenase